MSTAQTQYNSLAKELKKNYTNEFILLGILACAKKHGYKFQRMQIMKLLQKFKSAIQENLEFEAYHCEFVKDKHGDFCGDVYDQLTSLKQSDFIASEGEEPYELFFATEKGGDVFDKFKMDTGNDVKKMTLIKEYIAKIVQKEGNKSSEELRKENHSRIFIVEGQKKGMDELPNGVVTTPNLNTKEEFMLDDRLAIDWGLYKKIAKRKREKIISEEEMPKTQEEIYELLGLI
jgi:hypothetical protein